MQRVLRIEKARLSARSLRFAASLGALKRQLSFDPALANLFPTADDDGVYLNFQSTLEGEVKEGGALGADRLLTLKSVLNTLRDQQSLEAQVIEDALYFLEHGRHFLSVEKNPLILPYETLEEEQEVLKKLAAASRPPKKPLWPWLLLLLLLLLLGTIAAYFLLFKDQAEATVAPPAEQSSPVPVQPQAEPEPAPEPIPEPEPEPEVMVPVVAAPEPEIAVPVIAAPKEDPFKEAREAALAAEQAAIEKAQAESKPQPEPVVKAEPSVQETAKVPVKKLPKCSILRQESKMPALIMAIDGSYSMIERDVRDGSRWQTRLEAAHNAAIDTVNIIDKNVAVGLIEVNRCPTAISRGFFSGSERAALIGSIKSVQPRGNGTALISGLNTMAQMARGSGDSVGILLSDGLDTCSGGSVNFFGIRHNLGPDVCEVAQQIHSQLPDFKINVVLIGSEADKVRCVAQITGGRVYTPRTAAEFSASLKSAGSSLTEVCEE